MTEDNVDVPTAPSTERRRRRSVASSPRTHTKRRTVIAGISAAVAAVVLTTAWLGYRAMEARSELGAAAALAPRLKAEILQESTPAAAATLEQLKDHTDKARNSTNDPVWVLAGAVPWLGQNFRAAQDVAQSADEVAQSAAGPLLSIYQSLNWQALTPGPEGIDLQPLVAAQPMIAEAARTLGVASERLDGIDTSALIPQLAAPLSAAREEVKVLRQSVDVAADVSIVAPALLGDEFPRNYLLMIQNNAETRATGGIPGALAVLHVDNGKLTLGAQSSAGELGVMSPPVSVDPEQENIYSHRVGKFMQNVTLTPDFPTTAATARAMWERKSGQPVHGVISIDPVALSYVLGAIGPVTVAGPGTGIPAGYGLPTQLTADNVVPVLLSDVYAKIGNPEQQDAYFAGVAQQIFQVLSNGKSNAKGLVEALTRGTDEGRVLLWSAIEPEQSIIARHALSGSISGPSLSPAQFGAYFNDGTGAKMDYYVQRTVRLVEECARGTSKRVTVQVTSRNAAPADAARTLPAYVTGNGIFGVPAGSVQTNIIAYGPAHASLEAGTSNGERIAFASYVHSSRPVGVHTVRLAPGESSVTEFTFGKIEEHAQPVIAVTPTVMDVKDVALPTEKVPSCDQLK